MEVGKIWRTWKLNGLDVNAQLTRWFVSFAEFSCSIFVCLYCLFVFSIWILWPDSNKCVYLRYFGRNLCVYSECSKKQPSFFLLSHLLQILTDFQHSFTDTFSSKFAMKFVRCTLWRCSPFVSGVYDSIINIIYVKDLQDPTTPQTRRKSVNI